jgi:predicted amidohydrolase YtcJ
MKQIDPWPDKIFYNGKIVTVDKDFSIEEALAIKGDQFVAVGASKEVMRLAGQGTEKIDLKGKMAVPGFIDTHPHLAHAGPRSKGPSLRGLKSIEEIKKFIKGLAGKFAAEQWVITSPIGEPPYFFNVPGSLKEKRYPNRWDLDEAAPNHPVYITAPICRVPNAAILNSKALEIMGVAKETPSEQGNVKIEKDPKTGEPTGVIYGMSPIYNMSPFFYRFMSILPPMPDAMKVEGVKNLIDLYIASGITSVYEAHYGFSEELKLYMDLWSRKDLRLRCYFVYEVDTRKPIEEIEAYLKDLIHAMGSGFGDHHLKIGGICLSLDGPIWHGLANMREPYKDPYGNVTQGGQLCPMDKLRRIAFLAAENDLRMHTCFGGDRSLDLALQVYDEVNKKIPIRDKRWVVEHCIVAHQDQMDKCKELGLTVTNCTNFLWGKGIEVFEERMGKEAPYRVLPLRKWLDSGIPVAQSTDYGPFMPMFTLWQSLVRVAGLNGKSFLTPEQKITREEALRVYTYNGARAMFWEDKLGSIEVGKLADMVVLGEDILTCEEDKIKEISIEMTLIGGRVEYQRGSTPLRPL